MNHNSELPILPICFDKKMTKTAFYISKPVKDCLPIAESRRHSCPCAYEKRLMKFQWPNHQWMVIWHGQKGNQNDNIPFFWEQEEKIVFSEWLVWRKVQKDILEPLACNKIQQAATWSLHVQTKKMTSLAFPHIVHTAHVIGFPAWYGGQSKPKPHWVVTLYNRFPAWSPECPGSVFISRSMQM